MLGLVEIMLLFMVVMVGIVIGTSILGRGAGRRHRQVDGSMARVLQELERMNGRLNDVDERLAELTLMIDETSRPSLHDGGSRERDGV
jgi:hypothetical protein